MLNFGKYIFLISLLSVMCSSTGMSNNIDSLESRLASAGAEERIYVYNRLSESYINHSPEKALDYAQKAYELSISRKSLKGQADALNNIGLFYENSGNYQKALEYHQQSLLLRLETNNKKDIGQSYNNIGITYYHLQNFEKARENYIKSLNIRQETGDKDGIAKSLNNMGLLFIKWKKFSLALDYRYRLLNLVKESGDKAEIATVYSYIGLIYYYMDDYSKAIDYYQKELRLREEIGDIDQMDEFFTNLGRLYYSLPNYDIAIEYYQKAINIVYKRGDKIKLAKGYINIGNVYYDANEYNKALDYYTKALKLIEEKGSKKGKAILLNNIGMVYKSLGNYRKALEYCLESIKIKEEIGDSSNIFYPQTSIAEIYLKLKDYDKSIQNLNKALLSAVKDNQKSEMKATYFLFYTAYSLQGNFREALKYHEMYTDLKDTLINAEVNKKIAEIHVKYETEKKEQDNKALKKKNEIQRNYFIVISGLILILLVVIISRYRSKQKANNQLREMNSRINYQHNELERTYQQLQIKEENLRDANATKDKFFTIIAHDLRNPLQAIILSSDLLINKYKVMDGEQLIELIHNINRSGTHLSNLLTNLLQWSRTQTGKIDFNPDKVLLSILIQDNINLNRLYAEKKNITVTSTVSESLFVYADPNMTTTVMRNLIANAVKFTGINGSIKISALMKEDLVEVSITDTGIGLSEEDIKKLFRIDVHNATIGNSAEKGTGLGLILCKEFIEINGGKITVESQEGCGSTFRFTLPAYTGNNTQPIRSFITMNSILASK